jgi:hypothetical protein
VIARLNGGKGKLLSVGAKEILLKAIIQSITDFAMAVLEIPKKIRKELTDAMAAFWWKWEDTKENKRMHSCAWWRISIPKKGTQIQCLAVCKAQLASSLGFYRRSRIQSTAALVGSFHPKRL